MTEINKSNGISTSHPLTGRSIANSCHLLAQRQLPQLPDTSHDQQGSPFYNIVQKAIQIKMSKMYNL